MAYAMRNTEGGPDIGLASPTTPFKPRKGWLALSPLGLVSFALLVVVGAALASAWARSREWQGLAAGADRSSQAGLMKRAAQAAELARKAEDYLREAKRAAGVRPASPLLPTDSPWLGEELTPLVTTLGSLEAKRVAANPDWARVLTLRLYDAGVRSNSVVAAGCSGSFPGLNLALACACQALGAELIAVSSVTASTWGANQPGFTWPEIESRLARAGIIRPISVAVSVGGQGDMALDLEPSARLTARAIQEAVCARLGASLLTPGSLRDSVERRLELYQRSTRGRRIALYVNVGGTEASLGDSTASLRLRSGIVPAKPFDLSPGRGVIARFAEQGVPALSLLHVEGLAFRWGVTP